MTPGAALPKACVVALAAALLAGCSMAGTQAGTDLGGAAEGSSTAAGTGMPVAVGMPEPAAVGMPGGGSAAGRGMAQEALPSNSAGMAGTQAGAAGNDRAVIRSASGLLAVPDLGIARSSLLRIVDQLHGTVTSEHAASGTGTPTGVTPIDMVLDPGHSRPYLPYPAPDRYVDVSFTVPAASYEQAMRQVRTLGEVISLEQSTMDVTDQVVDTEARIRAARSSLTRVEQLLSQAGSLDEMLRIEQELAARQGNLDSLLAQQASLSTQVRQSFLSIRLVDKDDAEAWTDPGAEPGLGEQALAAIAATWATLVLALAYASPLVLLAGVIVAVAWTWARRTSRRRSRNPD